MLELIQDMAESKRKKLSLKTKKCQTERDGENETSSPDAKRLKTFAHNLESVPENEDTERIEDDVICLSDEDMTLKSCVAPVLDVEDEELKSLRKILISLRQQLTPCPYKRLPTVGEVEHLVTNVQSNSQGEATPEALYLEEDKEYSPLPQMCKACARKASQLYQKTDITVSSEDLSLISLHEINSRTRTSENENVYQEETAEKTVDSRESPKLTPKPPHTIPEVEVGTTLPQEENKRAGRQKTSNSLKGKKGDSGVENRNILQAEKTLGPMACPLCMQEFAKGCSQLEIDGHIAACLASAGDDVTW